MGMRFLAFYSDLIASFGIKLGECNSNGELVSLFFIYFMGSVQKININDNTVEWFLHRHFLNKRLVK